MARLKLGVLISGRGSNMAALLRATAEPGFPAEIVLVIANRADAGGLETAQAAGIATAVIDHQAFSGREPFEAAMDIALDAAGVELVCLAGFMRLLTASFVERRLGRMINIHPSLLPAFKGLHVQRQALAAGVRIAGCTVHFVTPDMDSGPILVQAAVPVLPGDDEDSLAARILKAEHRCYPQAVRLIAEGRVQLDGNLAWIDASSDQAEMLLSPLTR